jgi:hypothetical protein
MVAVRAHLIWYLIAIMAVLTLVSFLFTGLTIDPFSNPLLLLVLCALVAVSWFYRALRPDAHLQAAAQCAAQILLIFLLGILLTYAAMAAAFPYCDAHLYAIDQMLGLDRSAYLEFVNSRHWLAKIAELAYLSLLPQIALVPSILFISNDIPRLQALIFAFGIALLVTAGISMFTPAVAAFVYLDLTPSTYANIASTVYTHVPTLESLRSGTFRSIHLNNLEGLITFPSFHTTAGLMFAWALWTVPYVRWIGFIVNGALIAATPIDGAHYFVDLAGGVAVAIIAVCASRWLNRHGEPAIMRATTAVTQS